MNCTVASKGRDPRIVNVQIGYIEAGEHAVFASRSADLAQRVQRVNLFLVVIVAGEDGQVQYDYMIEVRWRGLGSAGFYG